MEDDVSRLERLLTSAKEAGDVGSLRGLVIELVEWHLSKARELDAALRSEFGLDAAGRFGAGPESHDASHATAS